MTLALETASGWLSLERFEFSRVGEWAVLRLLTCVDAEAASSAQVGLVASGQAELVIDCGANTPIQSPARAYRLEQRLLANLPRRGRGSGSQLLWRAVFAVPLELVESRGAIFQLTAGGQPALTLPAPRLRVIAPRALALAPAEEAAARVAVRRSRQRFAAAATAVILTGTSSPAVAFAAGVSGAGQTATTPSAMTSSGATTSQSAAGPSATTPATSTTSTTAAPAAPAVTSTSTSTAGSTAAAPAPAPAAPAPTPQPATTTPTPPAPVAPAEAAKSTASSTTASTPSHTQQHPGGSKMVRTAPKTSAVPSPTPPNCVTSTNGGAAVLSAQAKRRLVHAGLGITHARQVSCTPLTSSAGGQPPKRKHPTKATHPAQPTQPVKRAHPVTRTHPGAGPSKGRHATSRPTGGGAVENPKPGSTTSTAPTVSTLSPSAPGFLAPTAWSGTVSANANLTGAVRNLAGLLANGNRPPSFLIPIYMQAGKRYGVPWEVLAAINAIESDYGRDLSTSTAGAVGWMQFEPSTWREWGVAADGHSVANPWDPRDAIFSAARYLKAAGAQQSISKAVFAYNHAQWYVDEVLSRAQAIADHAQYEHVKTNKRGIFSVAFATGVKRHPVVKYSGGKLSHYDRLIASANMVSAANFPYLYGGGHEQPASFGPFDCSGAVSYVIQQAGYKVPTTVSGDIPIWKFPAGPGRVTIFYNPVHTYMRIGNRFFGTSGFARPGGGAGWFDVNKLPAGYLAQFREVHVPRLGRDSFAAPRLPKHPNF